MFFSTWLPSWLSKRVSVKSDPSQAKCIECQRDHTGLRAAIGWPLAVSVLGFCCISDTINALVIRLLVTKVCTVRLVA